MPRVRRTITPEQAAVSASKVSAVDRTLGLFDTVPKAESMLGTISTPEGITFEFITCKCGLKCSVGVFSQWGWMCNSCGRAVDPTGPREPGPTHPRPTAQRVEDFSRLAGEVVPASKPLPEATVVPIHPTNAKAMGLYSSKGIPTPRGAILVEDELYCGTCNAPLTITVLGPFFPCGHGGKSSITKEQLNEQAEDGYSGEFHVSPSLPEKNLMRRRVSKSETEPANDQASAPADADVAAEERPSAAIEAVPAERLSPTKVEASLNSTVKQAWGETQETVTVSWGEELFSPKQFHTVKIGPFHSTTAVRQGETHAQAMARAMKELTAFAEGERVRKRASFNEALNSK